MLGGAARFVLGRGGELFGDVRAEPFGAPPALAGCGVVGDDVCLQPVRRQSYTCPVGERGDRVRGGVEHGCNLRGGESFDLSEPEHFLPRSGKGMG